MRAGKLYLICPDCDIEQALRAEFGQDLLFLTALGAVFDFSAYEAAASLDELLHQEAVVELVIVNDAHCTFIENTICKEQRTPTQAEQELARLQANNAEKFASLNNTEQQALLARLNVHRQAYELLDVAFVGGRISDGLVQVSGVVYDRSSARFEQVPLAL